MSRNRMNGIPARASAHAWSVVGWLWVVACLDYLDRLALTSMRDSVTTGIVMTDAQFGLLTSAFLWVYGLVSPIGGFIADWFALLRANCTFYF